MDTRMLDVAIGLVMVFAIGSLLASAIQEGLASWKNSRGKNLKLAIESMGGDDSRVADELFKEPLVQSLFISTRGGPSYLSADVFSTALFSLLSKSTSVPMRQGTPGEFLSSITVQPGSPTGFGPLLDTLRTLATGVEQDWPAFENRVQAWYEQTGERSIGWFKRDTQRDIFIIGLAIAIVMNVDAIHIGNALWNDPALRESTVQMAKGLSEANAASTAASQVPAQPEVQAQATSTTDAVAAAQAATDEQFKKLKDDLDTLRKQKGVLGTTGADQATAAFRLTSSIARERRMRALPKYDPISLATIERQNDENLRLMIEALSSDTFAKLAQRDQSALRSLRESAEKAAAFLNTERSSSPAASPPKSEVMPSAGKDAGKEKVETCGGLGEAARKECAALCNELTGNEAKICRNAALLHALNSSGIPIGWDDGQFERLTGKDGSLALWTATLLGWLITAFAITLGAPFWFDLLGKLVKLRGSGGKAESARSSGEAGAPQSITGSTTPTSRSASDQPFDDALNDDEKKLSVTEIESLQKALVMRNDQITGRIDATTRTAISIWQRDNRIDGTGVLTASQISALLYPGASSGTLAADAAEGNPTTPGADNRQDPPASLQAKTQVEGQLTEHFTLDEFLISERAMREGIGNKPTPEVCANLQRLAEMLERVRTLLGNVPIRISSGYRSPELNRAVGGAKNSAHMKGLAADFSAPGFGTVLETARRIEASDLEFDKLINERGRWVHLGLADDNARPQRRVLSYYGDKYLDGLISKPV